MLEKSESLPIKKCTHCSLCERCCAENTERGWECKDADSTPFLKQKIFIQGKEFCGKSNPDVDCIYKYNGKDLLVIEIKAQPIKNIEPKELLSKINSVYSNLGNMSLKAFILQISSKLNSNKSPYQLLLHCQTMFKSVGININRDMMYSRKPELKHIRNKFKVIKCKKLNEDEISSLL